VLETRGPFSSLPREYIVPQQLHIYKAAGKARKLRNQIMALMRQLKEGIYLLFP
jgi:hypothetical protein